MVGNGVLKVFQMIFWIFQLKQLEVWVLDPNNSTSIFQPIKIAKKYCKKCQVV
jgi:hypothetical protein